MRWTDYFQKNMLKISFDKRRYSVFVVTLLILLAFCVRYAPVAQATAITVTNLNDSGPGSLRQAILDANSSIGLDTIDFDASLTGGTINLTSGNLSITDDLNIFGLGAGNLTISGNNSSNVFRIFDNPLVSVQIDGLTISGGRSSAGGAILNSGMLTVTNSTISGNNAELGGGGGIYNEDGTLTISNSNISNNEAEDDAGGGVYSYGGTVSVTDSIVSGNIANGRGGGIFHGSNISGQANPLTIANSIISDNVGGDGGGISHEGVTLTVSNSTISGNIGRDGAGIYGGFFGDSTIISSTISDNTAGSTGGGIRGTNLTIRNSTINENTAEAGGGIFALGTSTITNSTISNNIATGGGVSASGGGILLGVDTALTVTNSTISGNTAVDDGGGICNGCTDGTPGTNLSLISTIVANNNAPTGPDLFNDNFGLINLAEFNLIGVSADSDIPCGSLGNLCDIAALLGPLQNNGGSTETHALLLGSPAIDAGSPDCPPPDTDQRLYARPVDGNGDSIATCDIGSFEAIPGDVNIDGSVNLLDAIISLQAVSGMETPETDPIADINGDSRIGIDEAINALQVSSGLRGGSVTVTTPTGDNVIISILGFDLSFSSITNAGFTTVMVSENGPPLPSGFELVGTYFEISTTAQFTGPVEICLDYDYAGFSTEEEDSLQILHYDEGTSQWQNTTNSLDTSANRICAEVTGFSTFAFGIQIPLQEKYFVGNDITHSIEPWKTDGTPEGTLLVKDIVPGPDASAPAHFFEFNGNVFFGYGPDEDTNLYRTDGTAAGTVSMGFKNPSQFLVFNDMLYFRGDDDDPNTSYAAWYRSDGTDEGTVMLKDIWPAIGSFTYFFDRPTVAGSTLYFLADDGVHGYELWKLGTSGSPPVMVKDIYDGDCADNLFFPRDLTAVGDTLFFTASDTACNTGERLWKSDGTENGTVQVSGNVTPMMGSMRAVNSILYFAGYTSNTGIELWRSDGTEAGTALVRDIEPGTGSSQIAEMTEANGTLYFRAFTWASRYELWKSDGTYNGTVLVKDIWPDTGSGDPQYLTNVDGTLYFMAKDGIYGNELWKSDGTEEGTVMVKEITPGLVTSGNIYHLAPLNGKLLFQADDSTHGLELWTSDGTEEGTFMLKDVCPGACNGFKGF